MNRQGSESQGPAARAVFDLGWATRTGTAFGGSQSALVHRTCARESKQLPPRRFGIAEHIFENCYRLARFVQLLGTNPAQAKIGSGKFSRISGNFLTASNVRRHPACPCGFLS